MKKLVNVFDDDVEPDIEIKYFHFIHVNIYALTINKHSQSSRIIDSRTNNFRNMI